MNGKMLLIIHLIFAFHNKNDGKAEGITMASMLFCTGGGGIIIPFTSGQEIIQGFAGYLEFGCKGITLNPSKGFFKLYRTPTLEGQGEICNSTWTKASKSKF